MPWVKGQSGNPHPKMDARRRRINALFLKDLRDVWKEMGKDSLRRLADENPAKFIDAMLAIQPKNLQVEAEHKHSHAVLWVQALQSMPPIEEHAVARLPEPVDEQVIESK